MYPFLWTWGLNPNKDVKETISNEKTIQYDRDKHY